MSQNTNTQLSTVSGETITKLDDIAKNYQLAKIDDSPFGAAFATAVAIHDLRSLLTHDVMQPIMKLMNTPLGFLTDRTGRENWKGEAREPYSEEQVRDVIIEATLRGFYPVGNEFNILADRFYAAKAGLRRKVISHPGVTDFSDSYSVPKIAANENGAIVEAEATWRLNGIPKSIKRTFAVKGDKYAGADSYTGKATRKLLAVVYERLSGKSIPEGEVGDGELGMKPVEGREIDHAITDWEQQCADINAYNGRLKEQGVPEDEWEPLPPRPGASDAKTVEAEVEEVKETPWREVVITKEQFKAGAGKCLGDLDLKTLQAIRDTINKMSAPVRAGKPGISELLKAVCKGIKELTPEPAKATKLEGLRNLIQATPGITEKGVLAYVEANGAGKFSSLDELGEGIAGSLITVWVDDVDKIKALS